jgi:hypothetical protein
MGPGAASATGPSAGSEVDATGSTGSAVGADSSPSSSGDDASVATFLDSSANAAHDFSACPPSPQVGDFPLDVAAVLMASCQHCHKNPPANHAPFQLLNYEDILLPYSGLPRWQDMYKVIQIGSVPHMPPPIAPQLTAAQLKTLSDWLGACAVPLAEGTGGDVDHDAAASRAPPDGGTPDSGPSD